MKNYNLRNYPKLWRVVGVLTVGDLPKWPGPHQITLWFRLTTLTHVKTNLFLKTLHLKCQLTTKLIDITGKTYIKGYDLKKQRKKESGENRDKLESRKIFKN